MTQAEIKSNVEKKASDIEALISREFNPFCMVFGQQCYKAHGDLYFMITGLAWPETNGVIVAEYAYNEHEARNCMFEDGEMFDVQEMSEDEIFDALMAEIKGID